MQLQYRDWRDVISYGWFVQKCIEHTVPYAHIRQRAFDQVSKLVG